MTSQFTQPLEAAFTPDAPGAAAQSMMASQAVESLRLSEARYRRLFETAQDGILILDAITGQVVDANPFMRVLLGYSLEEFIGRKLWEIGPFKGTEASKTVFAELQIVDSVRYESISLERKNRQRVDAEFISNAYVAEGRRLIQCNIRDITERKRAEESLRLTEARYRRLFETAQDGILILDATTGQVVDANPFMQVLLGYSLEEFLGKKLWEVGPFKGIEAGKTVFAELQVKDSVRYESLSLEHKDGRRVAAEFVTNAYTAAQRRLIQCNIRDITERRRLEELALEKIAESKLTETALRSSEERFRQLVENIHEVFWMRDLAHAEMLYISPGYEAIWGRTCASLYAASNMWIDSVYVEDRARVVHAAKTRQIRGTYDETYRIVRPDGSIRWVRDKAFPIRNGSGEVSRLVGVAEDITEQKNLEEQSLRAQRLESIGMLAAGITHDLNNILAPIGMAATILRDRLSESSDLRLLDTLEKCAARGAGLVRQILGFASGVGGQPQLVQVKHLLRDVTEVMTETFPKSIILRQEVADDLWPIVANSTQIHQVLLNLCVNARDAMPQGGSLLLRAENCVLDLAAASRIEGARPGAWLVLHVEDTGSGIPPEILARIWEPFFTTKAADKGTGLGLSTVRGIVETRHGFITLQTTSGHGTAIRVYFPAAESSSPGSVSSDPEFAHRGHGELILLVDNEEFIRDIAKITLTQAGYRSVTAADGAEAITLFESYADEIALVITDLDMPNVDGAALAHVIRSYKPTLKILAMSGAGSGQAKEHPTHFASAFMAKPFTSKILLAQIHQLLPGISAAAA